MDRFLAIQIECDAPEIENKRSRGTEKRIAQQSKKVRLNDRERVSLIFFLLLLMDNGKYVNVSVNEIRC